MTKTNVEENLVMGGAFGCVIGGLFMAFGTMGNFLCEMLFWSFVLYVGVIYFEFVPKTVKSIIKKYHSIAGYLSYFAWVPLFVGSSIVLFLGSLLFVDYDINELNCLLNTAKVVLAVMMLGTLMLANIRKTDRARLICRI